MLLKRKVGKTIKNNYSATKSVWKTKHCWHKISYSRSSHKLSTTIRQAEKVFQKGSGKRYNSPIYSEIKNMKNLFLELKIIKIYNSFKGYASSYNVNTLNSFNPELQLNNLKTLNLQLETS